MMSRPLHEAEGSGLGRPRALTIEMIVDAGLRVGPGRLTMKAVAAELNVAVGTLYRYVGNRDGLIELIAKRQLREFQDERQPWQEFLRTFAWSCFRVMRANPGLLKLYLEGAFGPDTDADALESFLDGMIRRGFTAREAAWLYLYVQALGFGFAAYETNAAVLAAKGRDRSAILVDLLARRGHQLPQVAAAAGDYLTLDIEAIFAERLESLVDEITSTRVETAGPG
jgi:AcrR family transcriptional regulator